MGLTQKNGQFSLSIVFALQQPGLPLNRRDWLRLGGLGSLGFSLSDLLAGQKAKGSGTFGRAKSCIILFLGGGPPQHETFDPKPDAPREIRGEFSPIRTNVPGVHFCELLPRVGSFSLSM